MFTLSNTDMNTRITDVAFMGTSTVAGFIGSVDNYSGFLLTASSAVLLAVIRWQQHKQKIRHQEEIHKAQLDKIKLKK